MIVSLRDSNGIWYMMIRLILRFTVCSCEYLYLEDDFRRRYQHATLLFLWNLKEQEKGLIVAVYTQCPKRIPPTKKGVSISMMTIVSIMEYPSLNRKWSLSPCKQIGTPSNRRGILIKGDRNVCIYSHKRNLRPCWLAAWRETEKEFAHVGQRSVFHIFSDQLGPIRKVVEQ